MEFEHKVGAFDDEGLVANDKEKKDWKGIVISLLVIGSIMGAIIVSIILCTPDGDVDANKAKLEFDLLVSEQFRIQVFNGTWLSDHELVYVDQNGSIVIFDADTNKSSSMLVKTYDKTLHTMAGFKLSADRQSILFVSDMRYEFGAPISARYAIFNISSQTVEFLDDIIKVGNPMKTHHIQYATWGPVSSSIVFIESNDIYYVPDIAAASSAAGANIGFNYGTGGGGAPTSAELQTVSPTSNFAGNKHYLRLTKTGSLSDSIFNGIPDSLYRANIFNRPNEATLWWSPDGRYLAYLSFDDAQVEPTPIEYYENHLSQSGDSNYMPKIHYEKCPRAGGANPRVSVHIVDLTNISSNLGGDEAMSSANDIEQTTISPPTELTKQLKLDPRLGYYVTYVNWLSGSLNKLLIMWSNRAQTMSILSLCSNTNELGNRGGSIFSSPSRANAWKCDILTTFSQRIPPSLDADQTILSASNLNGTRLIFFALPRPDSIIGDHYHVAMLMGEERAPKYLTHGEFDIDRLIDYDVESDSLYFEAKIGEKAERHLYRISSIAQAGRRQTKCLTCELDEPCGYNNAHIAPGAKYFVHECLGPAIPKTHLRLLKAQKRPASVASSQQQYFAVRHNLSELNPNGPRPTTSGLNNSANHNGTLDELSSINVLGSNPNIEQLMRTKQMPIERFIAIKSNQQVPCDVYIKMYLPNEIEEERDKRFPLLIESSEIDQRNVWKRFELDWGKYLASKKQIIYAKMDCIRTRASAASSAGPSLTVPTGPTGLYGQSPTSLSDDIDDDQAMMNSSPLFNAKDQVEAIRFMAENVDLFPYIDRRRIAIWGPNSASAYVALATTINDDAKLIQCTIAVSPVTNWRYMSSYAAEHYLGLPWFSSNSLKYEQANLLRRSYEFALRKLLIVHGTADEQVHVQHSMQFIKSLTEHHLTGGVLHQMQLYPDVGHSLERVRRHFFLTLDGFVDRCFYQKPIAIKATEWKGKVRPKLY